MPNQLNSVRFQWRLCCGTRATDRLFKLFCVYFLDVSYGFRVETVLTQTPRLKQIGITLVNNIS